MDARHALGRRAEEAVESELVAQGFTILARNLRLGPLELDRVARREDLVVIVEVRTRGPASFDGPFASIDSVKRRRLLRAARRLWRERFSADPTVRRIRIDVAAVAFEAGEPVVTYVAAAVTE